MELPKDIKALVHSRHKDRYGVMRDVYVYVETDANGKADVRPLTEAMK